jgi:leucyl aminopeptidase
MKIAFAEKRPARAGALAVGVMTGRKLTPAAAALDKQTRGAVARAVHSGGFDGKRGEIVDLVTPAGVKVSRLLLVGLGKPAELTALAAQEIGGAIVAHLGEVGEGEAVLAIDLPKDAKAPLAAADLAAQLAFGARLRGYRFDRYRSARRPDEPTPVKRLTLVTADLKSARRAHASLDAVARGVILARDLVSEPPNVLYPLSFVARAKALRSLGVEVEALDVKRMKKLGMGALLAVGQGSAHEPRLLILRWPGRKRVGKAVAPFAFVGKGVTFDTGGIDIKPAKGMEEMKGDMAGGAVVVGLIAALAARKSPLPAVGVVPLVENMPSGHAYRPADIVRTMEGKTIEVIDTDAEGRMILVDALHYTVDRFRPRAIVDLATLTYSVIKALGHVFAGVLGNDDALAERLIAAGKETGERLWRLPLDPAYDEHLKSDIADIRQCAPDEESADCVHAAQLLQRFVGATPWAHLDIAGMEFLRKAGPTHPPGPSGFGVRLLDRFVAGHEG